MISVSFSKRPVHWLLENNSFHKYQKTNRKSLPQSKSAEPACFWDERFLILLSSGPMLGLGFPISCLSGPDTWQSLQFALSVPSGAAEAPSTLGPPPLPPIILDPAAWHCSHQPFLCISSPTSLTQDATLLDKRVPWSPLVPWSHTGQGYSYEASEKPSSGLRNRRSPEISKLGFPNHILGGWGPGDYVLNRTHLTGYIFNLYTAHLCLVLICFYPTSKVINQPQDRFMEAGRRHKTPGSETKDCIIHSTAGSMGAMSASPPHPQVQWQWHGGAQKEATEVLRYVRDTAVEPLLYNKQKVSLLLVPERHDLIFQSCSPQTQP